MKTQLIGPKLWPFLEPLISKPVRSPRGGRPRLDDRAVLNGILFVLASGIPWEELPQSLGFGSGMTCWRRLRDWQRQGVWERLHQALLTRLRQSDQIDWHRATQVPQFTGRICGVAPLGALEDQSLSVTPVAVFCASL